MGKTVEVGNFLLEGQNVRRTRGPVRVILGPLLGGLVKCFVVFIEFVRSDVGSCF